MEDRVARVYRFKKVLKYSILSLLIAIVGLLVFEYFRIKPNNVYFTNITSSSITVSWDTKVKTDATAIYIDKDNKLPFVILPVFRDRFFDTRDITKAELKAAAQSSQNQDGLEVTMNDIVTNVSVTDRGKYYTHHVEIKGLEPETEYSFMVGDSIVFRKVKDVNNELTAKTYAIPETILSPYPAYGAVRDAYNQIDVSIEELKIVNDGIIYFSYYDDATGEKSNLFSSPLNDLGNWYIDASHAVDNEGNAFRSTYMGKDGLFADLSLNLGPSGIWERQYHASMISPCDTFVINLPELNETIESDNESFYWQFPETLFLNKIFARETEGDCSDDSDCPDGWYCDRDVCVEDTTPDPTPAPTTPAPTTPAPTTPAPTTPAPTEPECSNSNPCNDYNKICVDGECVNNEDDDLEANDGYTEKCVFLGYCSCGLVEDPGNKNLHKPCTGRKDLKNCEDTFKANGCKDYLPEQENKTCDGYTGPVAFGDVELHNGVCRICGYKGSGSTRYVGWTPDDDDEYNENNNCAKNADAKNGKKGKSSFGEVCKDGDGCVCNGDENNITPFGDVCTIDNSTEVSLSIDCQASGSDGQWDWQKNVCVCENTYVQTDDKHICYKQTTEQSPTAIDNSGVVITNPEENVNDKYCWEKGLISVYKCIEEDCYTCVNGQWVVSTNSVSQSCESFIKNMNFSCPTLSTPFQLPICVVPNDKEYTGTYSCQVTDIDEFPVKSEWKKFYPNSDIYALSRVEKKSGEYCSDTDIACVCGDESLIEKGEFCPTVDGASGCELYYETTNNKTKTKNQVCNQNGNTCSPGGVIWYCNGPKIQSSSAIDSPLKFNTLTRSQIYAEESTTSEIYIIDQTTGLISDLESGIYSFENNGQTYFFDVSDEALATNNGNVLIYIDTNENGQYDEGTDTKVSTLGSQIEITTIQKNYKFNLEEGFNFVSFPFVVAYDEYKTAAALLAQLNDVYGDVIYSISRFDGAWKVVGQNVEVYDNNDFQLLPGQGYVIKAKEDVNITIPGKPIKYESAQDSAPVSLFPGWNLIGIYGNNVKTYTAKSMLQDINAYEPVDFTANNVSKWESDTQKYDGFQLEIDSGVEMEYGFDYTIDILKSYFVKVESGEGNWQPKLAE